MAFLPPIDLPGWELLFQGQVRVPRQLRYAGASFAALRFQRTSAAPVRTPAPGVVRTLVPPPDDSLALRTVIELQLNPFRARRIAQAIPFGLPTFYFVLDGVTVTTLPFASGDFLLAGTLIGSATGGILLCAGQDRLARDPALWSAQIAAADPGWAAFAAAIAAQTASGPNPPVLVLDHTGAPLVDAEVAITRGAQTATARLVAADGGDLQKAVARLHAANATEMPFETVFAGGAPVRVGGLAGTDAELTRVEDGAAAEGSIEVTPQARHVTFTDLKRWFAPQYANPALPPEFAPLADYSRGNRVTPFVNGLAYYEDLLAKLKQAAEEAGEGAGGGLHLVGGWQTFPDTQLARRDDDETATQHPVTLLEAVTLLGEQGGASRILSPQFFQLQPDDEITPGEMALVSLIVAGLLVARNVPAFRSDAGGIAVLCALFVANPLLVWWFLDVNGRPVEPNVDAVDELDALPSAVSRFAPFPARVEDNPLAPPLSGFPWDSLFTLDRNFGFYHQKFGVVRAGTSFYGYCGGIDINPNRLDDERHLAHGPYHDIHARVEGPAARDVALSFEQRWSRDGEGPLAFATPAANTLGSHGSFAAQVARTYYRPAHPSRALPWAPNGDRTIADTLLKAIGAAREFIYIEDQYFTAAPEFQDLLVAKVANREIRALVIVLPAIGDQPFGEMVRSGFIADLKAADGGAGIVRVGYPRRHYTVPDNELRASSGRLVLQADLPASAGVNQAIALGPKSRLPGPPFWVAVEGELMYVVDESSAQNLDPQNTSVFEVLRGDATRLVRGGAAPQGTRTRAHPAGAAATVVDVASIYVHAKSTIVDDVFLGIGSANINRRGHYHDGEITLYSVPQRLKSSRANPVAALRRRLWAEMLDLPLSTAEPLLEDPIAAARLFDRSPFLGNRFCDIEAYPLHLMLNTTGGDGLVLTLLKTAAGLALTLALDLAALYNGVIDPTSALEMDP